MIPAFLLKNPLASIAGVVAVLAIAAAGVQTIRLASTQAELAGEKLAFTEFKRDLVEETLRVTREAADRSDRAIAALTDELKGVSAVAGQAKTEIRYVQSSGGPCAADPVYRATIDGVRNTLAARGAGGGAGQTQRGPPAAVRGADADRPGRHPQ